MPRGNISSSSEPDMLHKFHHTIRQAISKLTPFGIQVVASALAYTTGVGAAQVLGSALCVSYNTRYISSILGCMGVASASALAGHMGRHVRQQLESGASLLQMLRTPFWREFQVDEVVLDAMCGRVAFKVLGGTFRKCMPSDLRFPGPFGYHSVPVGTSDYSSPVEKRQLSSFFRRDGCHHCGSRRTSHIIGDHMPPNKILKDVTAAKSSAASNLLDKAQAFLRLGRASSLAGQNYYAHCNKCSLAQGLLLRHSRRSPLVFHRVLVDPGALPGMLIGLRAYTVPPGSLTGGSSGTSQQSKGKRCLPVEASWIGRRDWPHNSTQHQQQSSVAFSATVAAAGQ